MKVKIDFSTYIVILLSFLAGYFEYVFLCLILIVVHECGHFLVGKLLNLNVKEVRIMAFGGVTVLDEDLNSSIYKEILMLVAGPLVQILFFLLLTYLNTLGIINPLTYSKISFINNALLSFNLLPILPLDGGKLVNNFLDLILSFQTSHLITIIISFISLPLLLLIDNKLFVLVLIIFLIIKLIEEISFHKYRINKLILERKIKCYRFKKTKTISSIYKIKRNENYILKDFNL